MICCDTNNQGFQFVRLNLNPLLMKTIGRDGRQILDDIGLEIVPDIDTDSSTFLKFTIQAM